MEVPGKNGNTIQKPNSDGQNILCQPCQSDGDSVQADGYCETCNEYFCSTCLKFHRKQSVTKNHVIRCKGEMPRVQVKSDPCLELCVAHKTEIVKFYCQDHDFVGCGDCMIFDHKVCKIQQVSQVSDNYGNSHELAKIQQKIEQIQKEMLSCKQKISGNLKATEEMKTKIISEIKAFRKDLNSYLDDAEAELIREMETRNAKNVSMQTELKTQCESLENEVKEIWNKLSSSKDKMNQLFVAAKLSEERLKFCQTSVADIASKCKINLCKFEPSKNMAVMKENQVPFGILNSQIKKSVNRKGIVSKSKKQMPKFESPNDMISVNLGENMPSGEIASETQVSTNQNRKFVDMKIQFVEKVNVRDEKDKNICWITGLAQISRKEILLSDYQNSSLKIYHLERNAITQTYTTSAGPWDVTMIDSDASAVTIPSEGTILFISTNNILSKSHSLAVRKGCKGIDHRNDMIAVSFQNPAAVQIFDKKGNILHEVSDMSILAYPTYISFGIDSTSIFVSDKRSSAVYELTADGLLKSTIKDGK